MGKLSLEIKQGENRDLSELETSLINSSLVAALKWGVLVKPEVASARTSQRLLEAHLKDPNHRGSILIGLGHLSAIATAIDERESHEVMMEDDLSCPRELLLSPEERTALTGLRSAIPSEADAIWGEYLDSLEQGGILTTCS